MKARTEKRSVQRILFSVGALMIVVLPAVLAPSAFTQQQGGPYTLNPSVIAGGGGASSSGTTRIDGTIGQGILGSSTGGNFSLNAGFWQNQPASTIDITGQILYCVAPVSTPVPNATLNLTGDTSALTSTDTSGNFQFSGLSSSGSYTVTPSKTGAVSGINAQDIGRVRRFVALLDTPTACQTIAANVDNTNPGVNAQDIGLLRRFVALLPGTGDAGTYKFNPPSRSFVSPVSNQTANFDANLVGDVDGNGTPAAPQKPGPPASPAANLTVSFPSVSANQGATVFVPITITGPLTAGDNILGYTLDFTFNQSVITTVPDPGVSFFTTGTISAAGGVTENKLLGANRYRLVVDFVNPLVFTGTQTLIFVKFNVVGAAGGPSTPLTWNGSPLTDFGNGPPAITTTLINGSVAVNNPTVAQLSEFAAASYDKGAFVHWQTGYEPHNLGFNVYRDENGTRTLLNPQIVAGSALLSGTEMVLKTGRSYGWWDASAPSKVSAQYWLEDIDLNGQSNWHGPVSPQLVGGTPPAQSNAAVFSRIGKPQTPHASTPVERRALARLNPGQAGIQPVPAGASAVKISVRREDWYSLSSTELVAAGFNPKPDPDHLQMYVDGEQVPINVITDDKNQLSAVEFYGTGLDAAYTDARVYLIVEGREKGSRIEQIKADAHPSSARSFSYSVERRDRTIYFSGLRNGDRENFFGSVVGREAVTQSLTLQHLDRSTTEQAQVEVSMQGVTTLPHRVWVNVNGSFVGEVAFNGQELKAASFSLPPSLLREGDNKVQLAAQGGPADVSLSDYLRLSYPRTFTAESDQLRFLATPGAAVTVDGFSNAAIRVFDVTNQDRVQQLVGKIEQGKNGYAITVAPAEQGERILLAIAGQTAGAQAGVSASVASDLIGNNHAANLLIITNRDFFSALEPLKKLRTSQGYKVEMVDVEAIYDQFSFGSKSPYAVREFLQYARANWKIAPQYVLLAADASYDPKNYLGFGDWDIVPTKLIDSYLMETPSDDWFVDFNADGVPELAVGRLPARSKEEAERLVARIVGYEQSSGAGELTLVADANDGYDFEAATAQLRALVPGDIRVVEIDRGRMGSQAKPALIEAINRGQKIVNYTGHGNVDQWRADLLTNADAALLTNQNHLAVFVMMTCLNGYFDDPAINSLAEALMKTGSGGAVAVWASSGMTMPDEQALMNREFYRQLFANRGTALGDAIKRAKAAISEGDVRRTWILLGDPTMLVR